MINVSHFKYKTKWLECLFVKLHIGYIVKMCGDPSCCWFIQSLYLFTCCFCLTGGLSVATWNTWARPSQSLTLSVFPRGNPFHYVGALVCFVFLFKDVMRLSTFTHHSQHHAHRTPQTTESVTSCSFAILLSLVNFPKYMPLQHCAPFFLMVLWAKCLTHA